MNTTTTDPIHVKWTTFEPSVTSAELAHKLGTFKVDELADNITPYLAAASAELASMTAAPWLRNGDGLTVGLLRTIAREALVNPDATGVHIQRLFAELEDLELFRGTSTL